MTRPLVYGSGKSTLLEAIAKLFSAAIFEIVSEKPYMAADLKWTNPLARCNREKFGKKQVPVVGKVENGIEYERKL